MAHSHQTIEIESQALGHRQPVTILAPHREYAGEKLRTLFLLHGMGGDHTRWVEKNDVAQFVDGKPILVVAPSCENCFYMDSPVGLMETFICDELLPYIDTYYPTEANPTARGLSGYSMGGYGAMILALRNLHLFGSAASHSGAVLTSRATTEVGIKWELGDILYGTGIDGEIKRNEHDILTLANKLMLPNEQGVRRYTGPALYFDCGTEDFLFYATRELTQALRMLQIPYQLHEYPGEHNWEYWSKVVDCGVKFHCEHWFNS